MTAPILFVDDEPNVLHGIRRQLRQRYPVVLAEGPEQGVAALKAHRFAAIVSDIRMPGMNGIQFLGVAQKAQPDAVRMVLSGEASLDVALAAVNQGQIFRYFRKPVPPDELRAGLDQALELYRLRSAEKELLEKTLQGSLGMLMEALALNQPKVFRDSVRLIAFVEHVANKLGLGDDWQLKLAAKLARIGCVALPEDVVEEALKVPHPGRQFHQHAAVGKGLLKPIPRLEGVAEIVGAQGIDHQGPGSVDGWDPMALRGVVLDFCVALDHRVEVGQNMEAALVGLARFPAFLHQAIADFEIYREHGIPAEIAIGALRAGMRLAEDVQTLTGTKVIAGGQLVTEVMLSRIHRFHQRAGLVQPLRVYTDPT